MESGRDGSIPMTRGNVTPFNRGRNNNNPEKSNELAKLKQEAQPDNDKELKKKQREAQFAIKHQMDKKVYWKEIGPILTEMDQKTIMMGNRTEALFLALRRFNPDFSSLFADSKNRINRWREVVGTIIHTMKLSDIRDIFVKWNSDPENPLISANCFPDEWSIGKFSADNPDATLSLEEKRDFMVRLSYTKEFIDRCCPQENFTSQPELEETPQ